MSDEKVISEPKSNDQKLVDGAAAWLQRQGKRPSPKLIRNVLAKAYRSARRRADKEEFKAAPPLPSYVCPKCHERFADCELRAAHKATHWQGRHNAI